MSVVAARENMVDSQVRTNDVTDVHLQAAMRSVHREDFCSEPADLAYAEREAAVAPGRWLMLPRDLGKLLQALAPRPGETALVICEPYAAALLARAGLTVTAVDTTGAIAIAGPALSAEGATVVDGEPAALSVDGKFDIIIGGGAVGEAPAAWLDRLAPDGRAGVIVRTGRPGRAWLYTRAADGVSGRPIFECTPPFLPNMEPKAAFVF